MRFLFAIYFFVLEIFTFLHYANEEIDDVIDGSTKTVLHSISISLEIYEQCSSHLAPEMYITKGRECHLLSCCHGNTLGSSLFLWKTKYPHFLPFKVEQRGLTLNTHGSHIVLTLLIRLFGGDDPCLR